MVRNTNVAFEWIGGHTDNRRTITDVHLRSPAFDYALDTLGAIRTAGVGPLRIVGNHYHERKDELFYLVEGGALAVLLELDRNDRHVLQLNQYSRLVVPRRTVHTFVLNPGTVLLHGAFNVDQGADPLDPRDNISYMLADPSARWN